MIYRTADRRFVWGLNLVPGLNLGAIAHVIMSQEGDLVAAGSQWSSLWTGPAGSAVPGSHALLTDDGVLEVRRPDGTLAWASDGRQPEEPAASQADDVASDDYRDVPDDGFVYDDEAAAIRSGEVTWSYSDEDSWVEFAPLCGAGQQSPINIQTRKIVDLEGGSGIAFENREVSGQIVFSGYALEANVSGHRLQAEFPNLGTYTLQRVELHAPSEHRIDGKAFDAEQQMVFTQVDGSGAEKIAVVSILLTINPNITAPVWFVGGEYVANLGGLSDMEYVTYTGSLTAPRPDCLPGVNWFIQGSPYSIAPAEIDALRAAVGGDNARYYHQMDGRTVFKYRAW